MPLKNFSEKTKAGWGGKAKTKPAKGRKKEAPPMGRQGGKRRGKLFMLIAGQSQGLVGRQGNGVENAKVKGGPENSDENRGECQTKKLEGICQVQKKELRDDRRDRVGCDHVIKEEVTLSPVIRNFGETFGKRNNDERVNVLDLRKARYSPGKTPASPMKEITHRVEVLKKGERGWEWDMGERELQ